MNIQQEFNSLMTTYVNEEPKDIVQKICSRLEEHEINIYAVVDHQLDMNAVGVASYPAFTILFGNPRMGSKLLEKLPVATIDIPLRLAVIKSESGRGSTIIFRDMEHLFEEYISRVEKLRKWAQEINHILTSLVDQSIKN